MPLREQQKGRWHGGHPPAVYQRRAGARALGFSMRPCTGDSSQQSAVTDMGRGAKKEWGYTYQFSSVAQSCLTLCNPMDGGARLGYSPWGCKELDMTE